MIFRFITDLLFPLTKRQLIQEYTGIGRDKLYELTNPEDCPFVLWIGNRRMIKRRVFDEYIEKCYSI